MSVWAMAQSFVRNEAESSYLIGFIALTGISGVLFFAGLLQSLAVLFYVDRYKRGTLFGLISGLVFLVAIGDIRTMTKKPAGSKGRILRIMRHKQTGIGRIK